MAPDRIVTILRFFTAFVPHSVVRKHALFVTRFRGGKRDILSPKRVLCTTLWGHRIRENHKKKKKYNTIEVRCVLQIKVTDHDFGLGKGLFWGLNFIQKLNLILEDTVKKRALVSSSLSSYDQAGTVTMP